MTLSIDNISKPSNKKMKAVADFVLYTLPLYLTAIMATPLSDDIKLWANFAITIVTVTVKGLSKLTADEPPANVSTT